MRDLDDRVGNRKGKSIQRGAEEKGNLVLWMCEKNITVFIMLVFFTFWFPCFIPSVLLVEAFVVFPIFFGLVFSPHLTSVFISSSPSSLSVFTPDSPRSRAREPGFAGFDGRATGSDDRN